MVSPLFYSILSRDQRTLMTPAGIGAAPNDRNMTRPAFLQWNAHNGTVNGERFDVEKRVRTSDTGTFPRSPDQQSA